MGNSAKFGRPVGDVRLCLELCRRLDGLDPVWTVVASIPGRETVSRRSWKVIGRTLNEKQLEDVVAFVGRAVSDATLLIDGVQGQLPVAT